MLLGVHGMIFLPKEYMFSFGPMLLFEWLSCYQIKENFWDQAYSLTRNIIELKNESHIFDWCKGNNGLYFDFGNGSSKKIEYYICDLKDNQIKLRLW